MKKALKISKIILGSLLLAIILLFVVAKSKEKEIADIALQRISQSIKAPLEIGDISLSLLRKFPLATIEFEAVRLGTQNALNLSDSLISEGETLANIKKIFVSVKTIPLFKGEFDIMKVVIKGVDFSYIVNKQGISNFDFLIDTTQTDTATSSSRLHVLLKELMLRDVHCNYFDSLNLMSAELVIPKVEVNGELMNEQLRVSATGELTLTNCTYKTSPLHLMDEAVFDFDLAYSGDTVNVNELTVLTDGAELSLLGSIVLKDTIETNISFEGKDLNIGELIKYAPKQTLTDIGLEKVSGMLYLKASVRGLISDSILPEVKVKLELTNGSVDMKSYPSVKNISFIGSLTNGKQRNNKSTGVTVQKFHAETGNSRIDMSFSIKDLDRIQYKINSELQIDVSDFKKYIPDSIATDASGQIDATIATKGVLPDSIGNDFIDYLLETSQLDITFSNFFIALDSTLSLDSLSGNLNYEFNHLTARDFTLKIPDYNVNLNNSSFDAQLSGKPSQLSTFGIDLKSFQLKTDSCSVYGSAKILNLEIPEYSINCSIKLNLGEVKSMLPDSLVNTASGEISAQIASNGQMNLDSVSSQLNDLIFKSSSLNFTFDKVTLNMQDTLLNVKDFSGRISMKSDTITINKTSGIYQGIEFGIDSTKIVNLYNSVIKNQVSQLYVEGRFSLGETDYTMFAPFLAKKEETAITPAENKESPSKAKTSDSILTNYTYLIKGKLKVKNFTYEKAEVENVSALFRLSDSLYLIDQFKFTAFGGIHTTSLRYSIKAKENTLWVKNSAENMNVNQLLRDFDNFKAYYEPAITHENISGYLSSNFDSQILFIGDSLVRNKMYVKCDIKIEKGGIYNYKPVQDMAQYLPGIDNLDKLEFKTINSKIFVFQDAIYAPTTLIISNKLDAKALGMQSFEEDYSYHFMVFLSDVLTGKSKKINKEQDEEGDEITDAGRKGIPVRSYSINGKSRSGLDNSDDRDEMERKVKASEVLLNLRFHPNTVNYNTGVN